MLGRTPSIAESGGIAPLDVRGGNRVSGLKLAALALSPPLSSTGWETMLKPRNFLASALVCAALAACADGPTLAPDVQAPESPAFDGGHMLGSGGRTEDPS